MALDREAEDDPAGWLAGIAGRARVEETPGPGGPMVWRLWGGADGEPLALLHGGHGSWNHWCRNVEPLAEAGFLVAAADLPGLGDSADPGPPYAADPIAGTVAYGLSRLFGDAPVHIAGFSFGAAVGGAAAERLGPRVASFNAVGAAGFGPRARRPDRMRRIDPDMPEADRRAAARNNMEWLMLADPANVGELAVHIQLANTARARTLSRPISNTPRLLDALPAILAPVNAIWGERDRTVLGALDERIDLLREARPDARVDIVEGAGHWTQFEAADRYNELLADAIRG